MEHGEPLHPDSALAEFDKVPLTYQEFGWPDRAVVAEAEAITARAARSHLQKFADLAGRLVTSTVQYQGEMYAIGASMAYTIAWRN
jgi:hypothetical protein